MLAVSPVFAESDPVTDLRGDCGSYARVSTYGADNREEYCSQNSLVRGLADSVAGLFSDGSSVTLSGLPYVFTGPQLGVKFSLVPGQRFADQKAAAFCSGFLVGDDLLATAGHCVRDHASHNTAAPRSHAGPCQENLSQGDYCENIRVVFGFRKDLGGAIAKGAYAKNVYKCAEVVSHSLSGGPDYALIRLDRKVSGRWPLAINRDNAGLSRNTPLFVIGHPSGLPLKIAGDAMVISSGTDVYVNRRGVSRKWVDNAYSFLTNLDAFHGNSGSPVFNLNTMLVEGILVKGDNDYEPHPARPGKNQVTNFPQEAGASDIGKGVGEVCTKISAPAANIPASRHEAVMLEMNRKAGNRLYYKLLEILYMRVLEQQKKQRQFRPEFIPNYVVPEKPSPDLFES